MRAFLLSAALLFSLAAEAWAADARVVIVSLGDCCPDEAWVEAETIARAEFAALDFEVQVVPGAAVAMTVFVTLVVLIYRTPWRSAGIIIEEATTTRFIGRAFMTTYILPFEAASILLLLALIGAAMLVRGRTDL